MAIWYHHPRICQKWVLTHTVNFGKGSAFPGFAFSEGLGPALNPLYKSDVKDLSNVAVYTLFA